LTPVRYLLDTNTVSYIIKGNVPRVRERLMKAPMAQVAISVITEAELRFGVVRRPEAARLKIAVEEFLLRVAILPWDSEAAKRYAQIRAALEGAGEPMGNLDMMIAAQALAAGMVLVTSDRAFRRVKGLKMEDWGRESLAGSPSYAKGKIRP
jgi:tRNA(fMet)-specific endonuclease VapC